MANIKIRALSPRIGAEISQLQLSSEIDSELFNLIYQALLKYKVIFIRGQQHLNDIEQEKFSALFGSPIKHPTVPTARNSNYIFELDSQYGARADNWHTDVSFIDNYPKICILRAIKIPEIGGDTMWANTESAYLDLPEPLQLFAHQLRAIHANDFDYGGVRPHAASSIVSRHQQVFASSVYQTEHPLVRIHPETQQPSLLLGQFFKRFVGLTTQNSFKIFDVFQSYITRPENTVRWSWQQGDVVIWDNRSTQHLAVDDYGDAHRIVRRVTVEGEVPIGVDHRASRMLPSTTLAESSILSRAQ